ncbi:helix-turn-helix transcriptional regulator [Streptomyces sp. VNUA116]|uniref:helix-turn-helix domain-containing protein n=1 Tax=Streptomyces sp. VNUA116 TaxID=3062449 RepID=UPI0026760B2A|nr:helix-turn-helix transcriptional regulator [Streptomyces sp. VNUA116]WKU45021.1 helix-turn-helix transcriptional regulator [Streptomyces sp. VNUA116]
MRHAARRTARRRKLGTELRALREAADVSPEEAAKAIHGDRTKISRQETGQHRVTRLELEVLLSLYSVSDEKRREWLIALASEGPKRTWWRRHSDKLPDGFKELLDLESEAARISAFQSQVVPGLLQTQAYATALISGASTSLTEEQRDFFVDFRMSRQNIFLRGTPPQYTAIMAEGVLHQQIGGPAVLAEQLRHLVHLSQSPDITIQVIPFSLTSFTDSGGSFALYSYPDPLDLDVVQVEHLDGALCLEDNKTVAKYRRALDRLRSSALPPEASIELIASIARGLEHE